MSFYRFIIAGFAAMTLATSVFAGTTNTPENTPETNPTMQQGTMNEGTQTTASEEKVDINKASAKDLMKVKGINSTKAKAIVSYRKKHGDFKSVEDIKEVKVFKKMNEQQMQEIMDQLTV